MADRFGRSSDPNAVGHDDDDLDSPSPAATPVPRGPGSSSSAGPGGSERIDSQVQKAQEQLLNLRRQQDQIEKQKRELEELSRRQEELEEGRAEIGEKLTRALVVLDRQTTEAQKRVEQLRSTTESFTSHLRTLESINPKSWGNNDMQKELSRALSMVDHARSEYNQQKVRLATDADGNAVAGADAAHGGLEGYEDAFGDGDHGFMYWLKAGLAFTLPLLILGLIALAIFCWRSFS